MYLKYILTIDLRLSTFIFERLYLQNNVRLLIQDNKTQSKRENRMQLTVHTDFALRVLIYLTIRPDKMVTIDEITEFYEISRNHLVKVVHNLSSKGFISTSRGKHGGMQLSRPPEEIFIGDVVRQIEANFDIVECFNPASKKCSVAPICNLKSVLQDANENFLSYLDQYSLAEAIKPSSQLKRMISNLSV